MYIKRLLVKNFQSHKKTLLRFHPHVNVIAPKSDTNPNMIGKTSIIRALYCLCFNRPSTVNFYSNFAPNNNYMVIRATFVDNLFAKLAKKVRYMKSGKKKMENAYYQISGQDKYRKFGVNVPDAVTSLLRIGEINFAQQLDEPFLITSPSSKVSKEINKVTRLDEVDNWISDLNSKIRESKVKIDTILESIEEKEQEVNSLEGIEKINKLLLRATRIKNSVDSKEKKIALLQTKIKNITSYTQDIYAIRELLKFLPVKTIEQMEKLEAKIGHLQDSFDSITHSIKKIKWITTNINDYKKELSDLIEVYSKKLLKLKVCPTCYQSVSKSQVQKIVKEM